MIYGILGEVTEEIKQDVTAYCELCEEQGEQSIHGVLGEVNLTKQDDHNFAVIYNIRYLSEAIDIYEMAVSANHCPVIFITYLNNDASVLLADHLNSLFSNYEDVCVMPPLLTI